MWEDFELSLDNGQTLGGRWIGDPSKTSIVVYFHGFPGSRVEAMLGHLAAVERGVTLLAFDRPGLGKSRIDAGLEIERVTDVLMEGINRLGISKLNIIAVSGGTPYAVSFANRMTNRIERCAFVSPLWDTTNPTHLREMNIANRSLIRLGQLVPPFGSAVLNGMGWLWRTFPKVATAWFGTVLPAVDRKILRRKSVLPIMNQNLAEALSQGVRGVTNEYVRFSSHSWPVRATGVNIPVRIWHGTADDYVPIVMARALADEVPNSIFTLVDGGGHFMMVDILGDVLNWCIDKE